MSIKLFDLTGEVALVTGGTHGLGMAMANGLGAAGATLVINDLNQDKLDDARRIYRKAGFDVKTYLFDVTNEKKVMEMIPLIEKEVRSHHHSGE